MTSKFARWIVLAALFVLPFLALYTSGSMYFPFITGKNFLFRILVELAAVAWIVLALAEPKYRPQRSWILILFTALTAWSFLADCLALNAHKALWSNYERMDGWVMLIHVFLLFVVMGAVLGADKLWRRWWLTFVTASTLVVLYGWGQLFGWFPIHQSSTRLDATLGNAEYLGGLLLFAIGVTVWQALVTPRKEAWLRWTLFAAAALDLIVLFKTGTRGTFVGLAGALAVGGLLWLVQGGKGARKGAAIFITALVVLAGVYFSVRHASFVQNDPNLSRIANISVHELAPRFDIWNMAFKGIAAKPVTGWGHEGFNYVFNTYYVPTMYSQEPWFDRAHSIYLDWAIANGLPALALFLALFVMAVIAVYRTREQGTASRIAILAMLAGYAVQGLVVFDNLFTYMPLAALLAYAHCLRSKPFERLAQAAPVRGTSLDMVAAPVALVLALAVVYMVNIPSMQAAGDLIDGLTPTAPADVRLHYFKAALDEHPFATQEIREQLLTFASQVASTPSVPAQTKQEVVQYANDQFQQELAHASRDARLVIQYAMFLRNIGQFDAARTASAHARELSPQKQTIILEQGVEAWQGGDPTAAREFFKEAYDLAPQSDDYAAYYAIGHVISGDTAGGKQLLAQHFGTTTIDNVPLALAYQQVKDWDDFIAVLRLHTQASGDIISGYQLALALGQASRVAEARAQVQAMLTAHPETSSYADAVLAQLHLK